MLRLKIVQVAVIAASIIAAGGVEAVAGSGPCGATQPAPCGEGAHYWNGRTKSSNDPFYGVKASITKYDPKLCNSPLAMSSAWVGLSSQDAKWAQVGYRKELGTGGELLVYYEFKMGATFGDGCTKRGYLAGASPQNNVDYQVLGSGSTWVVVHGQSSIGGPSNCTPCKMNQVQWMAETFYQNTQLVGDNNQKVTFGGPCQYLNDSGWRAVLGTTPPDGWSKSVSNAMISSFGQSTNMNATYFDVWDKRCP